MVRDYARKSRRKKTRLTKIEERKNVKQAFLFSFLAVVSVIILISLGIPALIKLAVFLGELRSSSQKVEKKDLLAPNPPILQTLPEATNSAEIHLEGFAEPNSMVDINLNGQSVKKIMVDSEGKFISGRLSLKNEENKIKAQTIDQANNESDFCQIITISLDTEKPILEITSPDDGQEFFDQDKEIEVKGKTEAEVLLWLNKRLVTVDPQGDFAISLKLNEGENSISLKARDPAGNETEKEIKVTYIP